MAVVDEPGTSTEVVPAASFKERLARRRRELEADTTFELKVPGYDDLWARCRALGAEEMRLIGLRIEGEVAEMGLEPEEAQARGERLTAAESLSEACIELLEFKGLNDQQRPIFESTGYRFTWQAARDLFGVDLPEGVSARTAVEFIFPYPRDMLMLMMSSDYMERSLGFLPEIDKVLSGESPAASAATTSGSSRPQR